MVFAVDLQSNDNNLLDKCRLRMMDEEAASTKCWVIMDYAHFVARKQEGSRATAKILYQIFFVRRRFGQVKSNCDRFKQVITS